MKLLIALTTLLSTSAFADGFICETVTGDLNVKVFNHTQPEMGTRNAHIMVLSDPRVETIGRKTIATMKAPKQLSSAGASYLAKVDLRFNSSNRKGENILGTKLGKIKTIALDLDYNFSQPVAAGSYVAGMITANKRNGEVISEEVSCSRYLKN